ncbi:MAG TPA: gamma-glutamyltransferase [Candidatus Baltobacteraceae bacterium]|nr:gamma-glutamyltransferase [Candidatus Baltobacteraceae bacterium]
MKRAVSITALAVLLCAAATPSIQPAPWQSIRPASAAHAMVATEQHYATQVGIDILKRGGNAVDAAIAVAYALAVVDPCCGNIGGGGFMLVRMNDGRERFIDFREKAPLRANPHMYLDAEGNVIPHASTKGYLAVGVPGTVMGMERARQEFATMQRHELMAPAIFLAQKGFRIGPGDAAIFKGARGVDSPYTFENQPNVKAIFMNDGRLPQPGTVLRQPQLAQTLKLIAQDGERAFYDGPIAKAVTDASYKEGGMLSMDDFKNYTVGEQAPIHCSYRGYDVISAPPPSSGGVTLCEILNITAAYPLHEWGWHSEQSAHYVIEAERRAYADRNTYLGDPAFVQNPITDLLSQGYAAKLRASISADKATPSVQIHPGLGPVAHENDETTHFSIVDKWGNAVAVTYTINDAFGAGVIAGDTGFFLNDEMDDFTSKPGVPNMFGLVQGVRNDIEPGKRPLSSMTPTIITKNGKLFMVTGSPGGARIITIVLSTIQNVLDYGMNVQQAVNAPRIHMQWLPDEIQAEPDALDANATSALTAMGYTIKEISSWGSAQAVLVDPKTGMRYGGTDRRHPAGLAAGY